MADSYGRLTDDMRNSWPSRVVRKLDELSDYAAQLRAGWIPRAWIATRGDSVSVLAMRAQDRGHDETGAFDELELGAGEGMDLSTELEIPENVFGVAIAGEPLELTLSSLRPTTITVDDIAIFEDELPVVACGPALITVVDSLRAGQNGRLRIRLLPTQTALTAPLATWFLTTRFTTPGLRQRFELIDLAYARLLLAISVAGTIEDLTTVDRALARIPEDFIERDNHELSLLLGDGPNGLATILAPLARKIERMRIHCVGHSHIDLAWIWNYEDARKVIVRDLTSVADLLDDYPEFRFTHSQAAGYAEVQSADPELFSRLKEHIVTGRLEPASLQWVEADTNLPSGPSHARQLMEGVRYTRDELGGNGKVLLAPDAFGHAGNLPQMVRSSGGTIYYSHRANPGYERQNSRMPLYRWAGDDGTELIAISTPTYLGPVTASKLAHDLIELGLKNNLDDVCYFFGVGDHGGGPTREDLDAIATLNSAIGFPSVVCSTVSDYVDAALSGNPELPTVRGESGTVFEGCYITHADSKSMNRRAESKLVTAETIAALAGLDRAATMSGAWKKALFHQFHDIVGGSAVASAYDHQRADFDSLSKIVDGVLDDGLAVLARGVDVGRLCVTNPTGAPYTGEVRIPSDLLFSLTAIVGVEQLASDRLSAVGEGGERNPVQRTVDGDWMFVASLDAFETTSFSLVPAGTETIGTSRVSPPAGLRADQLLQVDTPAFRAFVHRGSGALTYLFDKDTQLPIIGKPDFTPESLSHIRPELGLGVVQRLLELPHAMSSWVFDDVISEQSLISQGQTTLVEDGPVRTVLRTEHILGDSAVVVDVVFWESLWRVDFEFDFRWRERGDAESGIPSLAVSFNLGFNPARIMHETPFAAVEFESNGFLRCGQRWVAAESAAYHGAAILNDGRYGFEPLGGRIRYFLARSAYEPDPASDFGIKDKVRFSVVPLAGSLEKSNLVGQAAAFNQPLIAHLPSSEATSSASAIGVPRLEGHSTAAIAGLLPQDGGGYLIRLFETMGGSTTTTIVGLPLKGVVECDLLGDPLGLEADTSDGTFELELGPFEVVTIYCPPVES